MSAIIDILFHPLPNAIMTVLAGVSMLYWLFTMLLGDGLEMDGTDIDFDGADVRDVELSAEGEAAAEPSLATRAMDFINLGKAPLMVIVTLFKFIGWIITLVSSIVFNLADFGWKSVLVLLPVFLLTYLLMHYVTIPVVRLYQKVGYTGDEALELLGRSGKMRSAIRGDKIGAAEFVIQRDIIRLNVKSLNGETLDYGDNVAVTGETDGKKYYYVTKV